MPTKKPIAEALRDRLADVAERGRILGRALRVRADMAAARRRLRSTYAELGEEVYGRLRSGRLAEDEGLAGFRQRIEGLMAEIHGREARLRELMHGGGRRPVPGSAGSEGESGRGRDPGAVGSGTGGE